MEKYWVIVKHQDGVTENHLVLCEKEDDSRAYDLRDELHFMFPRAKVLVTKQLVS